MVQSFQLCGTGYFSCFLYYFSPPLLCIASAYCSDDLAIVCPFSHKGTLCEYLCWQSSV